MGAVTFSLDPRLAAGLKASLPLALFVETGTFKGEGVATALALFDRVVSIEHSESLWREAAARFAGEPRAEVIHGNSSDVLAGLRGRFAAVPTLFWLDAHWCVADGTAGERSQCPLLDELAAIGALDPRSVVLIDDARLFLAPPPEPHDVTQWPAFHPIVAALRAIGPSHELMVVNDVIAFHPPPAREAMARFARQHGVDWLQARQSLEDNDALRATAADRLAEMLKKDEAIEELTRSLVAKEEAIERLTRSLVAKEEAIEELTRGLVAKEAVIDEQGAALASYRAAFAPYAPFVRPFLRFREYLARDRVAQVRAALRPKLGSLNQYPPRVLQLPAGHATPAALERAPRISITTPTFRQAAFIERTLASVLDQGYPSLEYHVQDGGSDDGTVEVLERYASRLTSWDSSPDEGQAQAINLGFAGTPAGEIMAWLNSDDVLFPGSLAYVADYFTRHPEVDVIYGHRILIDANDREIGRWILPRHDDAVMSWADYIPQETLFWRRRIWDKAGGRIDESFRFAMDWDLLIRFRDAGARFARVPRFLAGFRVHPQQKTSAAIAEVGFGEMDRIRERALGRVPSQGEIARSVAGYMGRHVIADAWWRLGAAFGSRVAGMIRPAAAAPRNGT